jgi:hypothetical protein
MPLPGLAVADLGAQVLSWGLRNWKVAGLILLLATSATMNGLQRWKIGRLERAAVKHEQTVADLESSLVRAGENLVAEREGRNRDRQRAVDLGRMLSDQQEAVAALEALSVAQKEALRRADERAATELRRIAAERDAAYQENADLVATAKNCPEAVLAAFGSLVDGDTP